MKNEFELKIHEIKITVSVPDRWRAACYEKHVSRIFQELYQALTASKEKISFDKQSLLQDITKNIIPQLDRSVIIFLDRALTMYRSEKKINTDSLTSQAAESALNRYFTEEHKDELDTFSQNMNRAYPALAALLERLATNYINNIATAIGRITHDFKLIQQGFSSDPSAAIRWIHIKSTDSDLHRQGQQVLILEFALSRMRKEQEVSISIDIEKKKDSKISESDDQFKVVYKPTSIQADAMIVGDMRRLRELDSSYSEEVHSFIDILNIGLEIKNKQPLPTYLILPRCDEIKDKEKKQESIKNFYGYIEYIAHKPWEELGYAQLFEKYVRAYNPGNRKEISVTAQEEINQGFIKLLKKAAQDEKCDYIIRDQKAVDQYTYDCGTLIALMILTGISDMHCENVFIRAGRPLLLDIEICFQEACPSIDSTGCFDQSRGSMSRVALGFEKTVCLVDISGKVAGHFEHIEKKRVFQFFQQTTTELKACQPCGDQLKAGFEDAFAIVREQKALVEQWVAAPQLAKMRARYIPFGTEVFYRDLQAAEEKDFADEHLRNYLAKASWFAYEDYTKAKQSLAETKEFYQEFVLPNYVIYHDRSWDGGIASEMKALNIPAYYFLVASKELYDFNDKPLVIFTPLKPAEIKEKEQEVKSEQEESEATDFFPISPLEYIGNRITTLITQPTIITQLSSELITTASQLAAADSHSATLSTIL